MKFSLSTHLFVYDELSLDQLQMTSEAGLSHIELWCMHPHFPFHSWEKVKSLESWLQKFDLNLSSIHTPFYRNFEELHEKHLLCITDEDSSWRKTSIEEIKSSLKVAADLGAPYAVVHAGEKGDGDDETHIQRLRESVETLLPTAERYNVTIALENVPNDIAGSEQFLSIFKSIGSNNLGICLDTGHAAITNTPSELIKMYGNNLKTTHIHDNNGEEDQHLFPFQGSLDWNDIISAMKEIDYKGFWVLEPRKYDHSYEEHFEELKASIEKLQNEYSTA